MTNSTKITIPQKLSQDNEETGYIIVVQLRTCYNFNVVDSVHSEVMEAMK